MDKIKLTVDEVAKFKELQSKNGDMIFALGQVEIQLLNLDIVKSNLKRELEKLNNEQNMFAEEVQGKYGPGQVDIENEEYIPYPTGSYDQI